ncbi:MAG TPA: hypothetical protein DDZ68_00220 [Parvularcula sp.]|nr:hypothetical protein [Parvularcula sp.]HBS34830.1 hypothetical protein [Parvularcula sp.]
MPKKIAPKAQEFFLRGARAPQHREAIDKLVMRAAEMAPKSAVPLRVIRRGACNMVKTGGPDWLGR